MPEPRFRFRLAPAASKSPRFELLEERRMLTAAPELLIDIGSSEDGAFHGSPVDFVPVGDVAYFVADDGDHGNEIWVTDGTSAGTRLLRDISPEKEWYVTKPEKLTNVDGQLYFLSDGIDGQRRLWTSDGTEAGTLPVPTTSDLRIYNIAAIGGQLYISTYDKELWTSDGTVAGTHLVKDFGLIPKSSVPSGFTQVGDSVFFVSSVEGDTGLWITDGTELGTQLLHTFVPAGSNTSPMYLAAAGDLLYFTAYTTESGMELWRSDGTAEGTYQVADVTPGSTSSNLSYLTPAGELLYFTTYSHAIGKGTLWVTDGTAEGTHAVLDPSADVVYTHVSILAELQGSVVFSTGGVNLPSMLWKTDENGASYSRVVSSTGDELFAGGSPLKGDGVLYFTGSTSSSHRGLWQTDGTAAGTNLILGSIEGTYSPQDFARLGNRFLFTADDDFIGREVWITDNTAVGAHLLKNINLTRRESGYVRDFTDVNGRAFFVAHSFPQGHELWVSDGTRAGTMMVKDIWPGEGYGEPQYLTNVNGTLYFAANDGTHGVELWKSDGTEAGTVLVKDLYLDGDSSPRNLVNVDGTLYFVADDGVHGFELWKSDGTADGTVLVTDLLPGAGGSDPAELLNAAGKLYFVADDGAVGRELWQTDGSAIGTHLVQDINPFGSSHAKSLVFEDGKLYFAADDGVHGNELWRSDGTSLGTYLLKDITPGGADSHSELSDFVFAGGTLYFAVKTDVRYHPKELWKSDGTSAGTEVLPGYNDLHGPAVEFNGQLLFVGDEVVYLTDGTAEGSKRLFELDATQIAVSDGFAYLDVWSGVVQTDGTPQGTRFFGIDPTTDAESNVQELASIGGTIYFSAFHPVYGRDPWIIPAVAKPTVLTNYLFYNNSAYDGYTPGPSAADEFAIAPDKIAYQWADEAWDANISSYSRGINGVMIDTLAMLQSLAIEDFRFQVQVSYDGRRFFWIDAPQPSYFEFQPGAGVFGSDRVKLIWPDGAIKNTWLRIIVRGNDLVGGYNTRTGLTKSEVLHFGSSIGNTFEYGRGSGSEFTVNTYDVAQVFAHLGRALGTDDPHDFNRDGRVTTVDAAIAMANLGRIESLDWINNFPDLEEFVNGVDGPISFPSPVNATAVVIPAVATTTYRVDDADVGDAPVAIVRELPLQQQVRQVSFAELATDDEPPLFDEEDELSLSYLFE